MKIIPKLQQGGFASLFTQYLPVAVPSPQQLSARAASGSTRTEREESSGGRDKGTLTEKDLFDLISKIDGLPNDTQRLVSDLYNMFEMQQYSGGLDTANLASIYLQNLYQLKLASFNKKEYDEAYKETLKNGGLNSPAITVSGGVVVMDKDDKVKVVSVSEYLNNRDAYQTLTNGNLLRMRAYDPDYTNNNAVLSTVVNGIGIEQVDKMIKERLSSLGTTEISRQGYTIKQGEQIIQGFNVLNQVEGMNLANSSGMTLDGLYNNKIITKEQRQQALAALQYIYATLPDNAKTLLSLRSGNASNPEKGALDIIQLLITSRMSQSTTTSSDFEGTLEQVLSRGTRSSSGKNGDSSGNTSDAIKTDPFTNMVRMIGGTDITLTINKGTNYLMEVQGKNYGAVPKPDGTPIPSTSLANMLASGIQGIVTNPKGIYFGNVPLSTTDFTNIMFDGSAGGTMAILPAKMEGGTKVIDFSALDDWEAVNVELKSMGVDIDDPSKLQIVVLAMLKYPSLVGLIDLGNWTLDPSRLQLFLIVDGYAVDHSTQNKYGNSLYVQRVDDPSIIPVIEQALTTDSKDAYKIDQNNWYDWNGHNIIYRGSIYIPVTNNQLQSMTAAGQNVKEGPAMGKEYDWQMLLKRMNAGTTQAGALLTR